MARACASCRWRANDGRLPFGFSSTDDGQSAEERAAERRRYLDWFGALWWIGSELRGLNIMETITLTEAMPEMTPWRST